MSTRNFEAAQGKQTRTVSGSLRAMAGDEFSLVGYAAKYHSWSKDLGGFKERITNGAFARSLRERADVKALFNHQPDNILGRTKSGTLTLEDNAEGLRFRCMLNRNSQAHRDLYEAVKRRDIDECSFAFTVPPGGDDWTDGTDPEDNSRKIALRTLKDVDLLDVSVVTYPAYDRTSVGARSHKADGKTPADRTVDSGVDIFVRLAHSYAESNRHIMAAKRELPTPTLPYDYDTLARHVELVAQFLDAAYSTSETISDIMNSWADEEDDSLRMRVAYTKDAWRKLHDAYRKAHGSSHTALEVSRDFVGATQQAMNRLLTVKQIAD